MIAGAVVGAGARIAMRLVALGVPDGIQQLPSFTVEGTVAIMVLLALTGAPAGVLFAFARPRIPGPEWSRGVTFGLVLLAMLGPVFLRGSGEFLTDERRFLFAPLFVLFGLVIELVAEPSSRLARSLPTWSATLPALVALAGAALIAGGVVSLVRESLDRHGTDDIPALVASAIFAVFVLWRIRSTDAAAASRRT
ncbi:MAG: hypothetical protein EPO30_11775 [Lysobacteraceae bacterium]|nr:MAG: hypothetical protein EPO30_11775 [Xanthomonadaceae bacterium]